MLRALGGAELVAAARADDVEALCGLADEGAVDLDADAYASVGMEAVLPLVYDACRRAHIPVSACDLSRWSWHGVLPYLSAWRAGLVEASRAAKASHLSSLLLQSCLSRTLKRCGLLPGRSALSSKASTKPSPRTSPFSSVHVSFLSDATKMN